VQKVKIPTEEKFLVLVVSRKFANFPTFPYLRANILFNLLIPIITQKSTACFRSPIESIIIVVLNQMSPSDGVVIGKLKLKGKPLNVKNGGTKKKKKHDNSHHYSSEFNSGEDYPLSYLSVETQLQTLFT
jgi:hypothetical protein